MSASMIVGTSETQGSLGAGDGGATGEPSAPVRARPPSMLAGDELGTAQTRVASVEELERDLARAHQDLAHLRAVFDAAPDGIAQTGTRGVMCAANARLATMLNVPVEFLCGRSLVHFVARGDCQRFRDALIQIASFGACDPIDLRLRPRRRGRPFAAAIRANVVRSGRDAMVVWAIRPSVELHAPRPAPIHGGLGPLRRRREATRPRLPRTEGGSGS